MSVLSDFCCTYSISEVLNSRYDGAQNKSSFPRLFQLNEAALLWIILLIRAVMLIFILWQFGTDILDRYSELRTNTDTGDHCSQSRRTF